MNFLKIAVCCAFAGFFSIACMQTTTTNTVNKTAVVTDSTTANTPAAATPTAPVDEFASSKAIFQESCAGCHKQNGEGGEGLFQGKKIKVPSYKSQGAMNASDEKLANYITNGEEGEMPAYKDKLSPEEIKQMVKFIRKEFQGK